MFIDTSGSLGYEHARDMHRVADAHRASRAAGRRSFGLRGLTSRSHFGPSFNYRTR